MVWKGGRLRVRKGGGKGWENGEGLFFLWWEKGERNGWEKWEGYGCKKEEGYGCKKGRVMGGKRGWVLWVEGKGYCYSG